MHKFFHIGRRNLRALSLARQTRTGSDHRLRYLLSQLLVILLLHVLAMILLEGMTPTQAVWLTLTTVTTVGYGDISASTAEGQFATVLLLYILGIWMLTQLAGEYLDFRMDRRVRIKKGNWKWDRMKDHIVIVNVPDQDGEQYLLRLIAQFRATPSMAGKPVIIVTHLFPHGLPQALSDMGVVYKNTSTYRGDFFDEVNIAQASYILFLAQDALDPRSDSLTLDLLDQLKCHGIDAGDKTGVLAEAVQDSNIARFKTMGADSVLRPVRAYPELTVRALSAPGTESILEDLFSHFGASIHRYDIEVNGKTWKDVACALIQHELGTPLGYVDQLGDVQTCPPESDTISAKAILVMARDESIPDMSSIESCIAAA